MTDTRQRTTIGNRFRFLVRFLGLTGLLAVPAGWLLAAGALPTVPDWTADALRPAIESTLPLTEGSRGLPVQVGSILLLAGAAAVLLWLVVELLGGLFLVAGRKTAVGTNAALQIGLAAALLVIVNAVSFAHYLRFDLTRSKEFTLAPQLVSDLQTLRPDSPTTVVVLLQHRTGILSNRSDPEERAAERKVVEKVEDVVAQLRELGPRFNVVVLDVDAKGYRRLFREVTLRRPGLAEAINAAPDNSIFFYADGKVRRSPRAGAERTAAGTGPRPAVAPDPDDSTQALVYSGAVTRLSFTEFYQLDKTASVEATPAEREGLAVVGGSPAFAPSVPGKGNLVLIPRGKEAFVRKVLALEERRPKVGLAVIHPLLTSRENYDEYTAAGLRRSLEDHGFEVVDVILKKWTRAGPPSPAAYTYEESELDRAESRYNLFSLLAADRGLAVKLITESKTTAEKELAAHAAAKTDAEKARHVAAAAKGLQRFVRGGRITTVEQVRAVLAGLDQAASAFGAELTELNAQLAEAGTQYRDLLRNERAAENRRVTDLKAKLQQYVGDCDVLIVPRLTVVDISRGDVIPPNLFNLAKEQVEVVKEFLKAGKPVLFAVGPTNVDRRGLGADPAGDDVEKMLAQLGVELGKQTILTDAEGQAIAERQNEALGVSVDVPPLSFDAVGKDGKAANPIASAVLTTGRAVNGRLDVRKSGYRPVYVNPAVADRLPFAAEVAYTVRESWNEDKPIGDDDAVPKFEPAKPDDPKKGTHDEERRGPFPVGVAIETKVPADWFDPESKPGDESVKGLAPHYPLAALALGQDGGLYAAGLALAAEKVKRPTVRVVVLGHGGLFAGKQLPPAQETLLLHSLNWQLKRDDRLPANVPDAQKWRYPRVALGPSALRAWRWGTFLGLPLLVAYVGILALMARKVR